MGSKRLRRRLVWIIVCAPLAGVVCFAVSASATLERALMRHVFGVSPPQRHVPTGPKMLLALVRHSYLFQGAVVDGKTGERLDGAQLSLARGLGGAAQVRPVKIRADGEKVSRATVEAPGGSFRFSYHLKYCETHFIDRRTGKKTTPTRRPPPVVFVLTAKRTGYKPKSVEIGPPAVWNEKRRYEMTGIVVKLESRQPN